MTGLDGIPAEIWKLECLTDQLLEVCNRACHGDIHTVRLKGAILPFPKKGDLGSTTNYRDIVQMAVGAKLCNRLLLDRLRPHFDPKLRYNQNGFRKGRQILTLRRLVEGIRLKKPSTYCLFS